MSDPTTEVISAPGVSVKADQAYNKQCTAAKVISVREVQGNFPDTDINECS